jgi:hypothetical protein
LKGLNRTMTLTASIHESKNEMSKETLGQLIVFSD